ncbi:MAG TPA: restriction endonuclease subunit S, partial [Dehalococcoidia bacterium]|nr:restriction endonuclease subunit S [Dehalococcoidia bacterium]
MTATMPSAEPALETACLPESWTLVPLNSPGVCIINPPRPARGTVADDTPVSFVPMAAVDAAAGAICDAEERPLAAVRGSFTSFRDGDVIMAKITPCMENGKAAVCRNLASGLGFGSTEFHVLRPGPALLAEYVYYFVRQEAFRREAEGHMTGTVGQKRVPASFLAEHLIPLPPLPEQRRIVAALDAAFARLDAAKARLERVPGILKRYRAAVLAAAVEGRLTEDWRAAHAAELEPASVLLERILAERRARWEAEQQEKYRKAGRTPPLDWRSKYPEPAAPDTSELPELPDGWCWASLESVGRIHGGIQKQPSRTPKSNAY